MKTGLSTKRTNTSANKSAREKSPPKLPRPVHLEIAHPAARKVGIAGSFNDWQPAGLIRLGGGKWAIDLMLPPGAYEYRLVVDGNWVPDPNAARTAPNPFGEPNSLLIVPE